MPRRPARPILTAEQSADADRIHAALLHAAAGDLRHLAEQLAATTDKTIFGANEFAVRDIALGLAAKALQVAADDRAKKVTTGAVAPAPPAPARPSSHGGKPAPSSPSSATCG